MSRGVKCIQQKLREGFMATVAKSIRRVGGASSAAENLEESMKKAQEDVEILRSVVEPLEEEIKCLKDKYRACVTRVDQLEAERKQIFGSDPAAKLNLPHVDSNVDLDEKVRELNDYLRAEKASRSDLEMYVAILNAQKNVLQEEANTLKKEMSEVVRYLELERKQHRDLKMTWQMANDQFLEAQRLLMKDMRRMETLLSTEQQRQLAALQRKEQETERQRLLLEGVSAADDAASPKVKRKSPRTSPLRELLKPANELLGTLKKADSKSSLNSIKSDDFLGLNDHAGNFLDSNAVSNNGATPTKLSSAPFDEHDAISQLMAPSRASPQLKRARSPYDVTGSPDRTINVPNLTAAQQKAITDPTPERQETEVLIATLRSASCEDQVNMAGKRLVSEKEWQMLQFEIQSAREKLGRPCTMCNNYETQLQNIQQKLSETHDKMQSSERLLTATKKSLERELKYRDELEESLKNAAEDAQKQISSLVNKVYESEKFLVGVSQQYQASQRDLHDSLKQMTADREAVQAELRRLQDENDQLIGRHSKHSQAMQEETINLPDTLEDMQLALLRYREDIIAAKVAKEQTEYSLKSEIMFLKDQLSCEQQEKLRVEETLSADLVNLQEQLAMLQSVKSELDRETKVRREIEVKLRENDQALKSFQAKSKQLISALQRQVEEHSNARTTLEAEVLKLRSKIQSLQVDMDNSEAVQRDFVKLSQSLQIQLEKIRQAETEVRWQHEEDVEDCSNCRQSFSVTRRKHHCRHCGKIFCSDCTNKAVPSGPAHRPAKVCDVCHTILVKDATPYFSTEPPQTPD